jgi:predicted metal-dependent hydrolase
MDTADRDRLFEEGLSTYASGDHYEAHEKWEELWNEEDDDDERLFLQALIQLASAVHKLLHDVEPRGALRLLDRALEKTANHAAVHHGIALGELRQDIARFRKEAERAIPAGVKTLNRSLVPQIRRV